MVLSDQEVDQLVTMLCTGSHEQQNQAAQQLLAEPWSEVGTPEVDAWIEKLIQKVLSTQGAIPALFSLWEDGVVEALNLLNAMCCTSPASNDVRSRIAAQHPSIITSLLARAVNAPTAEARVRAINFLKTLALTPTVGRLIAQQGGVKELVRVLRNDNYMVPRHSACEALTILMRDSYNRSKQIADSGAVPGFIELANQAVRHNVPDTLASAVRAFNVTLVHLQPSDLPASHAQLMFDTAVRFLRPGVAAEIKEIAVNVLSSFVWLDRVRYLQPAWDTGAVVHATATAKYGSQACKLQVLQLLSQGYGICTKQQWQAAAAAGALDVTAAVLLAPGDRPKSRIAALVFADMADAAVPLAQAAAAAAGDGMFPALMAAVDDTEQPGDRGSLLLCMLHLLSAPFQPASVQQALAAGVVEQAYRYMGSVTDAGVQQKCAALVSNLLIASLGPGQQIHPKLQGAEQQLQALLEQQELDHTVVAVALKALANIAAVAPPGRAAAAKSLRLAGVWQHRAAAAEQGAESAGPAEQTHQALLQTQEHAGRLQCMTMIRSAEQFTSDAGFDYSGMLMPIEFGPGAEERTAETGAAAMAAIAAENKAKEAAGRACAACGAKQQQGSGKALQQCSRCNGEYYCSSRCQKGHWKVHKRACNKLGDVQVQASDGGKVITLSR